MNRREFLKGGAGALTASAFTGCRTACPEPKPAAGLRELGPVLTDVEMRTGTKVRGKCAACYIDDVIWCLRDLARTKPKSLFDVPYFAMLKECHDKWGFKVQLNLFYRTDFFYGADEFSLADVPDTWKHEFQAAKDWLKLGFHSKQEFPDYPWVNIDYADMKLIFGDFVREVERFAGPGVFTYAVVPHWVPVSKEGCQAMKDLGVKLLGATDGPRYAYNDDPNSLPYGHSMRLLNNRKSETALYRRISNDVAITSSLCGYNHTSTEQTERTNGTCGYVYDRVTGLGFKRFRSGPMLNLEKLADVEPEMAKAAAKHDVLVFACHEQYFFRDYLAYQPDYAEKFRIASKYAHDHGFKFIFVEDTVD